MFCAILRAVEVTELLSVLDDPVKLDEAKVRACQKVCRMISDLTAEELREKFEKGRQEHGEGIMEINAQEELRNEGKDAFWYSELEEIQLRKLT